MSSLRVDKWLWYVRIYKTRAVAVDALKKNRVRIETRTLKPSHTISIGDLLTVEKPPVRYTYRVKGFPKGRVGAKLVAEYREDLTPQSELEKHQIALQGQFQRPKGDGRPTKKERRSIDSLKDHFYDN